MIEAEAALESCGGTPNIELQSAAARYLSR